MSLPRQTDYDRKRQAQVIRKIQIPQGGVIPSIDRNVTTVGTGQLTVTTTPQQLSYVSRDKMAVKLTFLSGNDVYWSANAGLIPGDNGNGDLLSSSARGNWVSIPSPSVIWVACSAGTARISWAEAYDD
jgi:hypothetical protein